MAEINIKGVDESEIDTILAEDIDFDGELSFEEPLMIKGKFSGVINASGDLYIGKDAVIKATVEANIVSLKGKMTGNIGAHSRVELFATSRIEGDITTPELIVESGSRFNGKCAMEGGSAKKSEEKRER